MKTRPRTTLRERLAKRLQDAGVIVLPSDFRPVQGGERSSAINETYRWEAAGERNGVGIWLVSFSTMTDCAKHGVIVERDGEVHANH